MTLSYSALPDDAFQLYHLNTIESEILILELALEQEPQAVIQCSIFWLMLDFGRLKLLVDTVFGIDLTVMFVVTLSVQILSMTRNYSRAINRRRYPVLPGILGSALQGISITFLIAPKTLVLSASLLNVPFLHPLIGFCLAQLH